ncbi:MAG: beta-N-acetylhexosaminidase [Pacificimonas sp.]
MTPVICGLSGPVVTAEERALFQKAMPAGYILFARNIDTPDQVRELTAELRAISGRADLPVLIDQEGGRVQRLNPPHWPQHPSAAAFGEAWKVAPMTALEAARFHGIAIGQELYALGISVDCLPLLDVPVPGAHDIIGDRAFGGDPNMVASLGKALMDGLRESGTCAIVKHIPGHGRAGADSHKSLPVVTASRADLAADILPFQRLGAAPMAMTAHVLYEAIDPENCASLSSTLITDTIRTEIGFGGLLMCDDIGMSALKGSLATRMTGALDAGCDVVLHCSGDFAEMQGLFQNAPQMSDVALKRLTKAMAWAERDPVTVNDAVEQRDELLASITRS